MSNTVIKIENLSKRYRLGLVGTGTLKDDLKGWWYRARGKEDPTLKIGEENKLDTRSGNYIWALKDINLEVKEGEVLGIIGKNGAGKSTLLKILSKVTGPTSGIIKTRGRIASLLEVGTGMHPELTGRENVFLNGAILGMTKAEIRAKFDEIVDFAGVARYIDTPVKRYSSGMHVRLGFAVAAFLEPEILIVDEVLAVGDAEFQKKAIGKMQDVSKGQGRTVLFVSHNTLSIRSLCERCLLFSAGKITLNGEVDEVVDHYLMPNTGKDQTSFKEATKVSKDNKYRISGNINGTNIVKTGDDLQFNCQIEFDKKITARVDIGYKILNQDSIVLFSLSTKLTGDTILVKNREILKINCLVPSIDLYPGQYQATFQLNLNGEKAFYIDRFISFEVNEGDILGSGLLSRKGKGILIKKHSWEIN